MNVIVVNEQCNKFLWSSCQFYHEEVNSWSKLIYFFYILLHFPKMMFLSGKHYERNELPISVFPKLFAQNPWILRCLLHNTYVGKKYNKLHFSYGVNNEIISTKFKLH